MESVIYYCQYEHEVLSLTSHPSKSRTMLEDKKNTLVPTEIVIISAKLEKNIKKHWPCTLLETVFVQEMY